MRIIFYGSLDSCLPRRQLCQKTAMSSNQLKGSAKFIKENSSNWGTAILREKKSGNFGNFGHGKPGKVREFHMKPGNHGKLREIC